MQNFQKLPLLLILGASGTGKTTIYTKLIRTIANCIIVDADQFWRDEFNKPETNFIEFKNYCLKIANSISQNGYPVVYFLQGVPKDFEQCSERSSFSQIHYLFLICDSEELKGRLLSRPKGWGLLNKNPNYINDLLKYNAQLKQIAQNSTIPVFNTSNLTIEEISAQIYNWITSILINEYNR